MLQGIQIGVLMKYGSEYKRRKKYNVLLNVVRNFSQNVFYRGLYWNNAAETKFRRVSDDAWFYFDPINAKLMKRKESTEKYDYYHLEIMKKYGLVFNPEVNKMFDARDPFYSAVPVNKKDDTSGMF